ncbi:uncharacterized protein PHA67_000648 [Liasis olivaceus]
MEEDESKAKESAATDETKTQEEAERLAQEEAALRKEVEEFLREELDKLLIEKEASEEAEQLQTQKSQESNASKKSKGPKPKKTKDGGEQPPVQEKAEVEEDLLTLLDEPWDLPTDPTGFESEKPWDNLTLLEEPMLARGPEEQQEGPSGQDKLLKISEEEEEEEKEGDQLPLEEEEEKKKPSEQMLSEVGPKLVETSFLRLLEEEEKMKEEMKSNLRPTRSSIGTILEQKMQHLQKLKDMVQRRRISMIPFGYFSKLSKHLPSNVSGEKDEQTSKDGEPQDQLSRFMKIPTSKISSFRRKSLKKSQLEGDQVTKLSKIFNEDLFRSQDTRSSEDNQEEDQLTSGAEDFAEQKEEEVKQGQEGAGQARQQCDSFYSYPGVPSSMWRMGQRASHWQMGHHREFPDSIFQEKTYKQRFAKHERDSKVAMPLPLQEMMEEEVLAILKATLLDYQKKLGVHHPLTEQMESHVNKLHLQLQGRGII